MYRLFSVVCAATLALASTAFAASTSFELEPGLHVLPAISHGALSVYPVVRDTAAIKTGEYLTLKAGLAAREVRVLEKGQGGEVNRVTVVNASERSLLLLGGEIILGGQQDRVMSRDTIIGPHARADVTVFCVEHGRWTGGREFTTSGGMVEAKIKGRAKFEANQQRVWQQVADKTASLKGASETGTYRTLATGAAGQHATKPFHDSVMPALDALPERGQMVGLIASINGRVTAADIFASPALFSEYRGELLESLFVAAADVTAKQVAPAAPATIKAFFKEADDAKSKDVLERPEAKTVERRGKGVENDTLQARDGTQVLRSYQLSE